MIRIPDPGNHAQYLTPRACGVVRSWNKETIPRIFLAPERHLELLSDWPTLGGCTWRTWVSFKACHELPQLAPDSYGIDKLKWQQCLGEWSYRQPLRPRRHREPLSPLPPRVKPLRLSASVSLAACLLQSSSTQGVLREAFKENEVALTKKNVIVVRTTLRNMWAKPWLLAALFAGAALTLLYSGQVR